MALVIEYGEYLGLGFCSGHFHSHQIVPYRVITTPDQTVSYTMLEDLWYYCILVFNETQVPFVIGYCRTSAIIRYRSNRWPRCGNGAGLAGKPSRLVRARRSG
jgi:hypothetical protein